MPLILVGRYFPIRCISDSSYYRVFVAIDRYTPSYNLRIVKQLNVDNISDAAELETLQKKFAAEEKILEQIGHHPQIPEIFATFEFGQPAPSDGTLERAFYLVEEFIEGEDLEVELAKTGKFSEQQVLVFLHQILPVVQFIHQQSYIHQNIKPANIIRDRESRLHLIDFGGLKQIYRAKTSDSGGSGLYAMEYAAPEQANFEQVYMSTDVYAIGVTCLHLLTNKRPQELFNIETRAWEWQQYSQLSPELTEIINKMLYLNPYQRYQSIAEISYALSNLPIPSSVQNDIPTQIPSSVFTPLPINPIPSVDKVNGFDKVVPTTQPTRPIFRHHKFPLLDACLRAAFVGFEGSLLYVFLSSLAGSPPIAMGLWGAFLGSLIFAQIRRLSSKRVLAAAAFVTLAVVLAIPAIYGSWGRELIVAIAMTFAAGAAAVVALSRSIYQLFNRWF